MIESLDQLFAGMIVAGIVVGLAMSVYVARKVGKGILNIIFISFGFSIFFIGMSDAFTHFAESGFYNLHDVTKHVWWHMIVYLALISLIWGGYRIKQIVESNSAIGFNQKDKLVFGAMVAMMVGIFAIAQVLESRIGSTLVGSAIDTYGLHHLGAFVLAAIAGWYLFYIKGQWGALGTSIMLVAGFLFFLSAQHFWELITETFKIIRLEDEMIEFVEKLIMLPGVVLFIMSQWTIIKFIKR